MKNRYTSGVGRFARRFAWSAQHSGRYVAQIAALATLPIEVARHSGSVCRFERWNRDGSPEVLSTRDDASFQTALARRFYPQCPGTPPGTVARAPKSATYRLKCSALGANRRARARRRMMSQALWACPSSTLKKNSGRPDVCGHPHRQRHAPSSRSTACQSRGRRMNRTPETRYPVARLT